MDTIAAISTARAVSAIGVLRITGDGAFAAADKVFRSQSGKVLSACRERSMVYGTLYNKEGLPLDQVLAVRFDARASYTGEDSVEFHCHGSPIVLEEGLRALFAAGARQARGGEFTKRAFLNGRLDLTEAEAVIDLIESETAEAARNAVEQLGGSLRRQIDGVYDALLEITSRFYAVVDYPDEDIEDLQQEDIEHTLTIAETTLQQLLATCERGRVLKNGVATAIVGRPNVGKSSLLNALVGYDRAIVTDVAGTTRDTVEEKAIVGGVLLRLIDTAGIRETEDTVERIGVERSRSALEQAQLVLALVDSSRELSGEDMAVLEQASRHEKWVLVWSKNDLNPDTPVPFIRFTENSHEPAATVSISSLTGEGLQTLEDAIASLFPSGSAPVGSILTNARQIEAVERALSAIQSAKAAFLGGMTPDVILTDGEAALNALGEVTGRTLRDDLVERIFSRFCVGK